MAVNRTGAIYKALEIDGVSSRDFGVYITGEAVFNAPGREVEMISIPGRNGQLALDKGRFENIEVTYPAGIFADSEADFAEAISEFRNFLCSRGGYVRIQDDYNPNEYRMGVYKSGLEVSPALLRAGEFGITFDCKPQRWLTSGEKAITVSSGDTLTNPTLFESSPLLELTGKGDIQLGDETIEADISTLGWGDVGTMALDKTTGTVTYTIDNTSYYNAGDEIQIEKLYWLVVYAVSNKDVSQLTRTFGSQTGAGYYDATFERVGMSNGSTPLSFVAGTASTETYTLVVNYSYVLRGSTHTGTATFTFTATYNGTNSVVCTCAVSQTADHYLEAKFNYTLNGYADGFSTVIRADSSEPVAGDIFIDLDLGEAYTMEGGAITSMNNSVILPNKLPTLKSGDTTITYESSVTSLKITPRWWKV